MSTKYKFGDRVPNSILADRLDGLADAVTKGCDSINREFTMRIPAELDRDADLVMAEAAKRLRKKCNSCSNGYDGTRGNGYQPCACIRGKL